MRVRDKLTISERRQHQLTRAMEVGLVGMFFIGLDRMDPSIMVNSAIAFGVVNLPAILERDYNIPMDAGLTLWITGAVFLHALGAVGVPGVGTSFYKSVWWWDHLTHTISASVVAGVGYATARAIDEHTDAVHLPPRFMFVFILMFVLAFGVFWEVLEFAASGLGAVVGASILTQYGLEDTMMDLLFDTIGGVIVAVWGTAHLTDVVSALSHKLDNRSRT